MPPGPPWLIGSSWHARQLAVLQGSSDSENVPGPSLCSEAVLRVHWKEPTLGSDRHVSRRQLAPGLQSPSPSAHGRSLSEQCIVVHELRLSVRQVEPVVQSPSRVFASQLKANAWTRNMSPGRASPSGSSVAPLPGPNPQVGHSLTEKFESKMPVTLREKTGVVCARAVPSPAHNTEKEKQVIQRPFLIDCPLSYPVR